MIKPIDRENFESQLESFSIRAFVQQLKYLAKKINEIIDVTNANVEKVRHGKWIEKEHYTYGTTKICSLCGNKILDCGHTWDFCPRCGADMRRADDE